MRNFESFQAVNLIFHKENATLVVHLNMQEDQEGEQKQTPIHYW